MRWAGVKKISVSGVKLISGDLQGFLKKCRLNSKLFDRESVETIFSNLESLYEFQLDFLHQLEARVSPHHMEDSQSGEVFVACVSLCPHRSNACFVFSFS